MAEVDTLKALLDIVSGIITPVNAALSKQNEALVETASQLNSLVDLFQTEPTRHTIIEKLRDSLCDLEKEIQKAIQDHNLLCKERHTEYCLLGDKRGQDILKEATTAMKSIIEGHHKQAEILLGPVKELKDRFNWLLTAIGLSIVIGTGMFGYLAYTLSRLPSVGH